MIRKNLERFGICYLISCGVITIATWFVAFFNPVNTVLVRINSAGEMYPELIIHIVGLSCSVLIVDSHVRNYLRNRKSYVQKNQKYLSHIEVN